MVKHYEEPLSHDKPYNKAMQAFEESGMSFGATLTHEWLSRAFDIPYYGNTALFSTPQELKDAQLAYMEAMDKFKMMLAVDCNMQLDSVHGIGYKIVEPKDQTKWAETRLKMDLRKSFRQAAIRLQYIDTETLTHNEKLDNMQAIARLGFLRQNVSNKKLNALLERDKI